TESEAGYQPLSSLAIAAIGVASLTTVWMLATIWAARAAGKPAINHSAFMAALVGIALAVPARIQICRSEGTPRGPKMANVAWWLSVLCAGGYGAFYLATEVAVRQQAEDFTRLWFGKVLKSPPEAAFVYLIEPSLRLQIDENDVATIRNR